MPLHPTTAHAANATYYVDCSASTNGDGSPGNPWNALSSVNGHGSFQPGDHILLRAGTACNNQQLAPQGSGASGSPIVVDRYGTGNKPQINAQGNFYGAVYLHNLQYWEVNNLELTDLGPSNAYSRAGVLVTAASGTTLNHIYLQNLLIHDVNGSTVGDTGSEAVKGTGGIILLGDDTGTGAIAGSFNDVLIANNTVHDVGHSGIWIAAAVGSTTTPMATNVIIRNNAAYNIGGDGIWTYGAAGAVVDHNIVHDTGLYGVTSVALWFAYSDNSIAQYNEVYRASGSNDGEAFDCDVATNGHGSGNIFQYNYTHDNPSGFFTWYGSTNCVIRYNISQNDGTARYLFNRAGGAAGAHVYNNTFYIPGGTGSFSDGSFDGATTLTNNVIVNLSSASSWTHDGSPAGGNWDHNLIYGNHPANEPSDPSKLTSNPLFVSPGNAGLGLSTASVYYLQPGSPALGTGAVVGNNGGRDFFGNAVSSAAAPNRGAYNGPGVTSGGATINDTDSGLSYSGGGWNYSTNQAGYYNSDFHATPTNGASASYTFTGTGIAYDAGTCTDRGTVDVYVDGVYQTTVNAYASACNNTPQPLYSIAGLPLGAHTLTLVKTGGSYMVLDALTIQSTGATINDTDSGLSYSGGGWNYSTNQAGYYNSDFHATPTNGASASYTFTGTGIAYDAGKGPDRGTVDVYMDGVYQTTVNAYANAPNNTPQPLYSIAGLPLGAHTLTLVKTGGSYLVLDALTIQTTGETINDTDGGVGYSGGGWNYSTNQAGYYNSDSHATPTNGASASYTFTGTGIAYDVGVCMDRGTVDVYVDGVYQTTVNAYASACNNTPRPLYSIAGLPLGQHTLKLVKTGGSYMVLDALTYQ